MHLDILKELQAIHAQKPPAGLEIDSGVDGRSCRFFSKAAQK